MLGVMRASTRTWLVVVIGGCVLAGGAYALTRPGKGQSAKTGGASAAAVPRATPVVTAVTRAGDLPVSITALGSVTALNTVTVRSRVDGQLMKVHFSEGQLVRAGDLLAEIDPSPFEAQLTQAEGQLARDMAALQNARLDLERYRVLVDKEMIARQQYDTQAATVRQAEGAVKANQGQVELIKVQISYTRITAPLSGRVGLRLVDPGNMVKANDPGGLVVIAQIEPIAVVFAIPEDSLQPVLRQYRGGKAVPVEAYDREGKRKVATGTLAAIDNQIDPATGTVKLKASFPNHDGALFPNQFVNARVLLDVLPNVVLAPSEAIQRGPQGAFVYVVRPDGVAQMRRLELGPSDGGLVAVKQGLKAGEAVVVDGAEKLQDGAKVEPRERAPARTKS
ncbi:MAG: multidrug transporter subunit MdtA [Candidatus Rokuibacteriota bacterium]|nr:MAG: multidrug transporter subunit MdtA [Candidatus Rokubacteria bacterium]